MRYGCDWLVKDGDGKFDYCGEPTVDFVLSPGGHKKLWLCAKHYDEWCDTLRHIQESRQN